MTDCARSTWSPADDSRLIKLVNQMGAKNWSHIANHFEGRSGKQCRERWRNHLCPGLRKDPFTPEEDTAILEMVRTMGTKWANIAKHLPGRTDNSIKNRFNSSLRRLFDQQTRKAKHHIHDDSDDYESPTKKRVRVEVKDPQPVQSAAKLEETAADSFFNWDRVDEAPEVKYEMCATPVKPKTVLSGSGVVERQNFPTKVKPFSADDDFSEAEVMKLVMSAALSLCRMKDTGTEA
eukprot:c15959_g1_i1.p1 GENE.c15959_g1_i1~~c15959_g1_i1.p1  ORF type:complete len:270 (+),score=61.65 c15959_g1_i1:108-812(+)